MLTYFLEGRRPGSRPVQSQQQQQQAGSSERRSSAFNHGSVCTKLSPGPTVTTYASIRTPSPGTTKPTTSTSTTRYLPSAPTATVWQVLTRTRVTKLTFREREKWSLSSAPICGRRATIARWDWFRNLRPIRFSWFWLLERLGYRMLCSVATLLCYRSSEPTPKSCIHNNNNNKMHQNKTNSVACIQKIPLMTSADPFISV